MDLGYDNIIKNLLASDVESVPCLFISFFHPFSKIAMAARDPEPMVTYGNLSVDPRLKLINHEEQ